MDKSKFPKIRTVPAPQQTAYTPPINIKPAVSECARIWAQYGDDAICQAVLSYNIQVDKDELLKALAYDRNQYAAGYRAGLADGKEAGYAEGMHAAWEKIREAIGGAKDAD